MGEKVRDFKSIAHPTLAALAQGKVAGTAPAMLGTSDRTLEKGILEHAREEKQKIETPAPAAPEVTPPTQDGLGVDWSRVFIFIPKKEIVVVTRQQVGKSYNGEWIHEVKNKSGKLFLANEKQLGDAK